MRIEFVTGVDRQTMLAAIDDVLATLRDYHGEPIVAGEHPVHRAVVHLETLCILRVMDYRDGVDKKVCELPRPLRMIWFGMLWASRDRSGPDMPPPNARPSEFPEAVLRGGQKGRQPEIACAWRDVLDAALNSFRIVVAGGMYESVIASNEFSEASRRVASLIDCPYVAPTFTAGCDCGNNPGSVSVTPIQ